MNERAHNMGDGRAIGVFDSGVGGLTVLAAIQRALPNEQTVYLGDTARVPYGTRSADVVEKYAINNARTLQSLADIKILVVACNTATAVALPALERELDIPVVGVIGPGADAALKSTRGGDILVVGTAGTVKSGAYPRAFLARGHRGNVRTRACPLFVPLVEEGLTEGEIPVAIARRYLDDAMQDVDTIVLGCTHYPLLRATFASVVAASVRIVDGGEATADAVRRVLDEKDAHRLERATPTHRVLVTDAPEQMTTLAPRFLGRPLQRDAELVDIIFSSTGP